MLKPRKQLGTHKEIKQDKLVTYFFQVQEIFDRYKLPIILGILAVILLFALNFYSSQVSSTKEQEASVELARAKAAFEGARYQEATQILGPLTSQYSGTQSAGFGTVLLAKSFLALEKYNEAEQYFRIYLDEYNDDEMLATAAHTGLASCYDQKGEYDVAARAYEEAATKTALAFQAPELLIDAARCYTLANDKDSARRVLHLLVEKYPDSQSISNAKRLLAELSP